MKNKSVLILSGAGLSAESGVRTFRMEDGLWEEYDIMEVCSVEGFFKDREKVLGFYDKRRKDIEDKVPNNAHFMIAEMQNKYPDNVKVITQNVDDLLEKSGCGDTIHLHGKLTELTCEMCGHIFDIGYGSIKENPECPSCKSHGLRHNVVMFGEPAPEYQTLYNSLTSCGLLVVIGTSGYVLPVSQFAMYSQYSVLNNLDRSPAVDDRVFTHVFYENATSASPKIRDIIEEYLRS